MSWYTVKEVANFVGKSVDQVRKDIRNGRLRASRRGGRYIEYAIDEDDMYEAYPALCKKPLIGNGDKRFDQAEAYEILNKNLSDYIDFVCKTLKENVDGKQYHLAAATITAAAGEIKFLQGAMDYVEALKGFETFGYPHCLRIFNWGGKD